MTATAVSNPGLSDKIGHFISTLTAPKRPEPGYPVLPAADEQGATPSRPCLARHARERLRPAIEHGGH